MRNNKHTSLEKTKLLRAFDVADILEISTAKVYLMFRSRELPSIRIGRAIRCPLEALERWISSETAQTKRETKHEG